MKLIHLPGWDEWHAAGLHTLYTSLVNMALNNLGAAKMRHAAKIKRGPIVLGVGINSYKTSPLQQRFASDEHHIFLHAEIEAMARSSRRALGDLENTSCYVVRVNRKGDPASSKPCNGCMRALISFGVKECFHT